MVQQGHLEPGQYSLYSMHIPLKPEIGSCLVQRTIINLRSDIDIFAQPKLPSSMFNFSTLPDQTMRFVANN